MDNVKNWFIIGAISVISLVIGMVGLYKVSHISIPLGASGTDTDFPCQTRNGLLTCSYSVPFQVGTTSVAAIKSPNATTSVRTTARIDTSSTTQVSWFLSNNTVQYYGKGTTTVFNILDIAADAKGSLMATSTGLNLADTTTTAGVIDGTIIAPNTWIVLGASTTKRVSDLAPNTFAPAGRLNVEFRAL